MATATDHEPHGAHQTRKATASGWIGSALEYYDFIYATAASLVFPQLFFPKGDPTVAIVASLATYGDMIRVICMALMALFGAGGRVPAHAGRVDRVRQGGLNAGN